MPITSYIQNHIKLHPSVEPRDIAKLCYQAANGAEHLLTDISSAKEYFLQEYSAVSPKDAPLFEMISPQVCRVDLASWKGKGLPAEWLFNMFVSSARASEKTDGLLSEYLACAARLAEGGGTPFTAEEWQAFLAEYIRIGMPPLHHSENYRAKEAPSYRIADSQATRILPILLKMAEKGGGVVAIDGRAASGKTTIADLLRSVTGCSVVHMDDFFLPPSLRSAERLSSPGGNIHYERFKEEVLPHLHLREGFSYRRFDCSRMELGDLITVPSADWVAVEGSYSHHPEFKDYADITVFSHVKREEQKARILARDGDLYEMFETRWIPMEEEYFASYRIKEKADIIV